MPVTPSTVSSGDMRTAVAKRSAERACVKGGSVNKQLLTLNEHFILCGPLSSPNNPERWVLLNCVAHRIPPGMVQTQDIGVCGCRSKT
jgi:hypothetical protein